MLRLEGTAALPDGEGQVQQLAHGMADGDGFALRVLGRDAGIQGPHRRVAAQGAQGRHPQVASHQIVASPAHDPTPGRAGLAVTLDAAGDLDGQHAEIGDQLGRAGKAFDVEDEGGQHGRGDHADAGNGVQVIGLRQGLVGGNQQVFQAFLAGAAVTQLADVVAYQLLDGRAGQGGDGGVRCCQQGSHLGLRQIGDDSSSAAGWRSSLRKAA
jgi:hypothetical protein